MDTTSPTPQVYYVTPALTRAFWAAVRSAGLEAVRSAGEDAAAAAAALGAAAGGARPGSVDPTAGRTPRPLGALQDMLKVRGWRLASMRGDTDTWRHHGSPGETLAAPSRQASGEAYERAYDAVVTRLAPLPPDPADLLADYESGYLRALTGLLGGDADPARRPGRPAAAADSPERAVSGPMGWAPGLNAELSSNEFGHHWVLYWHAAELAHGTARTRHGRALALWWANRRWRAAGPAVGALTEMRARVQAEDRAEARLLNRRCRCSRPADQEVRDCLWHPSVSAQYARDLHQLIAELAKAPLPGEPTPTASDSRSAAIVAAIRRGVAAGHTGGRTDRPRRPGRDA